MILFLIRWTKRLLVLLLGLVIVYIAIWKILPFFDHRLPIAIGVLITYALIAYVLLPSTIRIARLFYRPKHIPLYCVTPDGFASDPINVGIIGTQQQIYKAMEKAGWQVSDSKNIATIVKSILFFIARKPYPTAPFSSLYLFGKKQELGFQKAVKNQRNSRHHVRFWSCNLIGPGAFHADVHFWARFRQQTGKEPSKQLWVGAASRDIGLAPIRYTTQITHMIAPDTNVERKILVEDLMRTGLVKSTETIQVGRPYSIRNRALRGILQTDGKTIICELKS